ncbi:TonB-dependent receptor [Thermomonas brevis]
MIKTNRLRDAILIALALSTAVVGTATAQEQEAGQSTKTLDAVTVTGSRIKRAEIEGAVPVTVIDRAQLEASGDMSVSDFLRDTNFNSFGSYQSSSGNSFQGAALVSLRGLGPGRTLVLVDGRRAPNAPMSGSGQDLNSIPMAAVERIELLSDGASSIYGSDAIGGVINIITRKDYEGLEFTIGKGIPTEAGGDTEEMSVVMGSSGDRGRVLAGASHSSRDVIFTRDRDYWYNVPGTSVYSNNFASYLTTGVPGRLRHPSFGTAVPGLCTNGNADDLFYTTGSGAGSVCQFNHSATSATLTGLKSNAAFLRGDFQIADDWMVYFNSSVNRTRSFGRYAPVPSSPWPGGAIRLNVGSKNHPSTIGGYNPNAADPYYQTAMVRIGTNADGTARMGLLKDNPMYLFHRFAALGARDGSTENTTYDFLGGFQGTAGMFDLDFGMRYSESRAMSLGLNYVVGGLAQAAIDRGAYNIYDPYSGDPTSLGMTATISRDMKTSIKEIYGTAAFDLFSLGGGSAAAVIGGEFREEYYQDNYDPLSEAGQIVGSAGNSAAGSRKVTAAFFEVLLPFTNTFEANLAGRFDKYNDYGSDFSPKLSVRWHPIDSLTLRASYGHGFKAPDLPLLTQKTAFSAAATSDPATCKMLTGSESCSTQVTTYGIANPNLGSETSKQWSAGIVWDTTDWLNLQLDYYDIHIDNQIAGVGLATVVRCLRGLPGLCPTGLTQFQDGTVLPNESLGLGAAFEGNNVNGGITGAQTGSANLGYIDTSGADFVARTNFDLGWGKLRNQLILSRVFDYASNGGTNVVDAQGYPKYRGSLSNGLSTNLVDFNWNMSYIHGTENYEGDGRLPSWLIHNVQASLKTNWNSTMTIGVNNVANKIPVFDPALGGTSYDYYLYDPFGRVVYFRYTQRF